MKTEHEIFSEFIESIKLAQSCATSLSDRRPDQPWQMVASKLEELKQGLYSMVGEGHTKDNPIGRIIQ